MLTQHDEVDPVPLYLPATFDFAGIFPRVSQQQVADQQGGVPAQVLPSEGQAAGLAAHRLIGVHPAPEEGDHLHRAQHTLNISHKITYLFYPNG